MNICYHCTIKHSGDAQCAKNYSGDCVICIDWHGVVCLKMVFCHHFPHYDISFCSTMALIPPRHYLQRRREEQFSRHVAGGTHGSCLLAHDLREAGSCFLVCGWPPAGIHLVHDRPLPAHRQAATHTPEGGWEAAGIRPKYLF